MNRSWQHDAACGGMGRAGEEFFPDPRRRLFTEAVIEALPCDYCPVRRDCLEHAVSSPWRPAGVWGGLREVDVVRLWRRRQRAERREMRAAS